MEIKVIAHYIKHQNDKKQELEVSLSVEVVDLGIQLKNVYCKRYENRFLLVKLDNKSGEINGKQCWYSTFMFKDYNKHKRFQKELQLTVSIYICEKILKVPLMQFEYFQKLAEKEERRELCNN